MTASLPANYFEALYARERDPWRFETSGYERAKYDATLNALPKTCYRSGLEIGCSIGVLTERLAKRCERLIATDPPHRRLIMPDRAAGSCPMSASSSAACPRIGPQDASTSSCCPRWSIISTAMIAALPGGPGCRLYRVLRPYRTRHWTGATGTSCPAMRPRSSLSPRLGDRAYFTLQQRTGAAL